MTDTTRLALALNELAAALLELTSGEVGGPPPPAPLAAPQTAGAGPSSPAPAAAFAAARPATGPGDPPGVCPVHGTPWSWKAPGVSKAGKPYNGFWKCDGKDEDGNFCSERPPR